MARVVMSGTAEPATAPTKKWRFHVRREILPTHREVVDGSRMLTAATGIRAADQSAEEKGEEKGDSHQIWVTLIANEAWPRLEAAPGAEDPVPRRA